MKNRLKLNFQLESAEERTSFVNEYLSSIDFVPNADELETISNYILWGKDSKGLNAQAAGDVELKKWSNKIKVESLEGLFELPGFQETQVRPLHEPAARIPRTVFDRKKALANAPNYLQETYKQLFRQIDEIELTLNFYELFCGKRIKPPRDALLARFTLEEQQRLNQEGIKLTQFKYLKLKHLLVQLRSQQYEYQDTYTSRIIAKKENQFSLDGADTINFFPLGLKGEDTLSQKIFGALSPENFNEKELRQVYKLLNTAPDRFYFDFRDEKHILTFYQNKRELEEECARDPQGIDSIAKNILDTLNFYEKKAYLSDLQKELLDLKVDKTPNLQIAKQLNEKYGKSYNENYISTIFHQKIIKQIAAAAKQHQTDFENIFYPENFKKCIDCGETLLLCPENWVKQKKSSDGFAPRCKRCDKIRRQKRNELKSKNDAGNGKVKSC